MKKVGFIIPDGTGIRNYVYSELIQHLKKKEIEIVLLHSVSDDALIEINKVHNSHLNAYKLPVYKETLHEKFLRETICYARLIHNSKLVNNKTLLTNWNPDKKSVKKAIFYKIVELIGKQVAKKYTRILKFEKRLFSTTRKNCKEQIELLETINPAVLFSTHQRAINAVPLVNAAKQLNIKTIGAIFSWDNPPKARLTVRTDEYIVWSNYMKNELELYYPEIKSHSIHITGTPQFEFHKKEAFLLEKEKFFTKYNLDPSKKTICFSGDDVKTSPYDPNYVEDIAEVIQKEKLNMQILLRRAPVDTSGRFNNVISKYPTIIKEAQPLWNFDKDNLTNWQIIYPKFEDIKLLMSTANYCDAVINVGSTMAHDFAMFSKPAIYINYNTVESNAWNIETIYQFQHFKSIGSLKPIRWLNSKEEIQTVLTTVLDNPTKDNIKWLDLIAEHREIASINIANTIISCT